MSERAVPFHCPYCGDEDLRPHAPEGAEGDAADIRGGWECRSCLRVFSLRLIGLLRPEGKS